MVVLGEKGTNFSKHTSGHSLSVDGFASHLEGNGLCRQHNCSLFTPSIKYLPWLISPHPILQNLLAKYWKGTTTYVIFPVWMQWESRWDGNGAHCLSWEESKDGGGLTPRFTILVLCQLTPRWMVFLWLFLRMFYTFRGSFSSSESQLWVKEMHHWNKKSRADMKSSKEMAAVYYCA